MHLFFVIVGVCSALVRAQPIDVKESGNLWIPNLRDTFITGQPSASVAIPTNYKIGDIVAEIDVSSGSNAPLPVNDDEEDDTINNLDYERCNDPKAKLTLFPMDNFNYPGNDRRQRPVVLTTEVYQLGRFSGTKRGSSSPSPSLSLIIEGSCCWETFTLTDYRGKMLRLCKGKYNSNILGRMAGNIRSLRPVKHF